jgi:hypothetical protein
MQERNDQLFGCIQFHLQNLVASVLDAIEPIAAAPFDLIMSLPSHKNAQNTKLKRPSSSIDYLHLALSLSRSPCAT